MKIRRFPMSIVYSLIAVFGFVSTSPSRMLAQENHTHMITSKNGNQNSEENNETNRLIKVVREATERFQNVSTTEAAGYYLQFKCVSGSDSRAMSMHFVNSALVMDNVLDATRPEIVIYEPLPNGRLRLI